MSRKDVVFHLWITSPGHFHTKRTCIIAAADAGAKALDFIYAKNFTGWGGGGGGFYSNGRSSTAFGGSYGNGGEGGRGFLQGGTGGQSWIKNGEGGFGGGGGAYGHGGGAGGGGGYSGGASGDNVVGSCGGGGGSYNIGKNQVHQEGNNDNGHGFIEIERLK